MTIFMTLVYWLFVFSYYWLILLYVCFIIICVALWRL